MGSGASDVDTDAAEELFRSTYPKLAGWVRRLVDDDDTAREIASEAFVRLPSPVDPGGEAAKLSLYDRDQSDT